MADMYDPTFEAIINHSFSYQNVSDSLVMVYAGAIKLGIKNQNFCKPLARFAALFVLNLQVSNGVPCIENCLESSVIVSYLIIPSIL